MSATNRGAERVADDLYETPAWCVHRLFDEVGASYLARGQHWAAQFGPSWCEPAVGGGAIVNAVESWPGRERFPPGWIRWTTADLRERPLAMPLDHVGDFRQYVGRHDLLITNPPYSLALDFAQHGLRVARTVVLLLRLNWLASEKRAAWLRENTPDIYVLPNRPSFTGGGTDATDYAWMEWRGARSTPPRVVILGTTPAAERRRTR